MCVLPSTRQNHGLELYRHKSWIENPRSAVTVRDKPSVPKCQGRLGLRRYLSSPSNLKVLSTEQFDIVLFILLVIFPWYQVHEYNGRRGIYKLGYLCLCVKGFEYLFLFVGVYGRVPVSISKSEVRTQINKNI